MITDDDIVQEARKRFPYNNTIDNHNRVSKMQARRRTFIEGASWLREKTFIKVPEQTKQECDRCDGKPETSDNKLCDNCYSDLHGM